MEQMMRLGNIESRIYQVRGKKVMLDVDLATLYGVETKVLLQSVRRNENRFPGDFMLLLTNQEVKSLRSQIVTSSWGGRRYSAYAFTEQGVAMLSSVLNSNRAIQVNIQIMRVFVGIRRTIATYSGLKRKIDDMEARYDAKFGIVFKAIKKLLAPPEKPKRMIGFHANR